MTTSTPCILLGIHLMLLVGPLIESDAFIRRPPDLIVDKLFYDHGRLLPRPNSEEMANIIDMVRDTNRTKPWVDDVNFHHIRDKDLPAGVELDIGDIAAGSPKICADSAVQKNVNLTVWKEGRCYFKRTDRCGLLTSTFAVPIGNYNLATPNFKNTSDIRVRNDWVRQGTCDMIHVGLGCPQPDSLRPKFGSIRASFYLLNDHYNCKQFSPSPGAVMMFRRNKIQEGTTIWMDIAYQPSSSK